jgi:hypothetical protein
VVRDIYLDQRTVNQVDTKEKTMVGMKLLQMQDEYFLVTKKRLRQNANVTQKIPPLQDNHKLYVDKHNRRDHRRIL